MKKKFSIIILVIIVLLLAGCSGKNESSKSSNNRNNPQSSAEKNHSNLKINNLSKSQQDNKQPIPQVPMTNGIPVLMYHKVDSDRLTGGLGLRVPEQNFDWQMKYLHDNGYHTVTLQDLIDHWHNGKKLPNKPIVITFDDGYQDNFTKAYPILKKYDFTATIFVIINYVGNINLWDIPNGQPPNKMLTWDQIRELQNNGIDIEAHTLSHPHLAKIPPSEVATEVSGAKKILEEKLNKKIDFMAYPFGSYNKTVEDIVRKSGYLASVVTDPQGKNNAKTDPYALLRVRVMGHYDNQTFVNILNNPELGYKIYLNNLRAHKKKSQNHGKVSKHSKIDSHNSLDVPNGTNRKKQYNEVINF